MLIALQDFERRGEKFDCVVMDPPYCSGGITPAAISSGGLKKYIDTVTLGDFEDGMTTAGFYRYLIEIFIRSRKILKRPGYLFSFIDWRMYPVMFTAMEGGGLRPLGAIVWDKRNARPNKGRFIQTCEFVLYSSNGGKKTTRSGGPSVIECKAPLINTRIHPTQKPVDIYSRFYRLLNDGSRILELFSGSASGGVAAIHNGFDYIGVESSPFYVASSRKRLRDELEKVQFLEPKKEEAPKEETPLFPSLENDDETL